MARISASRIDLYRQQLETVAQLIDRTGELREAFRAFHGDRPVSEYVTIPLDILSNELPRLQRQLERAKSDGEKRHYAEQAAMVRPEVEELLADLSAKLALLRSGGRLPEAWHFRSGPVELDRGWPGRRRRQRKRQSRKTADDLHRLRPLQRLFPATSPGSSTSAPM